MNSILRRRRGMMGIKMEDRILFQWLPSDGLTKLTLGGTTAVQPYISNDGLVLTASANKQADVSILDLSISESFEVQIGYKNANPTQVNALVAVSLYFNDMYTRCPREIDTYGNNKWYIFNGATKVATSTANFPSSGTIKAIYNAILDKVEYYINDTKIGETSNLPATSGTDKKVLRVQSSDTNSYSICLTQVVVKEV